MSAHRPPATGEWRRHWPVVAATTAGMSLASMLSASFGVMLGPIEEEFGWSRAQIASGPAIVSAMGMFLGIAAGYLIDRLGARACGIMVVVISCTAIASMSAVGDELWHWWAAWALFAMASAFTSTVWLAPVSTIFTAGRGLAIAITLSGTGISMALVPGLAEYFVQNHGWRMGFLALAAIWFVITLSLVVAFVPKLPRGASAKTSQTMPTTAPGLTPREGFRSPAFYLLFAASFLSAFAGVSLAINLVPVLTFTGLTRAEAVMAAGVMGMSSIVGRILGGWLMDRYQVSRLAAAAALCSLILPAMLLLVPGVLWAAAVGVIFYGLTGGMTMNAVVYLTSTHMGPRSFGLFYGTISTTASVAFGVAPLVANHIYDLTHSYAPVIWAAVPCYLLVALLFTALGPAPAPARRGSTL